MINFDTILKILFLANFYSVSMWFIFNDLLLKLIIKWKVLSIVISSWKKAMEKFKWKIYKLLKKLSLKKSSISSLNNNSYAIWLKYETPNI